MAKRIDESTADHSHGWVLSCTSYLWLMTSRNTAVYRYHGISWDGILSSDIS